MAATAVKQTDNESLSASGLHDQALNAIKACDSLKELQDIRVSYLGKKGSITSLLKQLGTLPPDERKEAGAQINRAKLSMQEAIDARQSVLESAALDQQLANEWQDISLAPRPEAKGGIHPVRYVVEEIVTLFSAMGFQTAHGPDIEDDFHNFTALNIPSHHPARQMHDTFYLQGYEHEEKPVLRTHTSPVQIRAMQTLGAPLRVICPGSTYRCDSDQTHTPMFHQVEGIALDENINMGHLKGTITRFLRDFFEMDDLPIRFRPSFFPFTEPSAEVDIGCTRKNGVLTIGHGDDWLEVMGCGMVHPNVLEHGDIDSSTYQGFAFGMGVERLAMLKYGMNDLRDFFQSDKRWLEHYSFGGFNIPGWHS